MSSREPPSISDQKLYACLQAEYKLQPVVLEFLPRGHDYRAGLYRVVSAQGASHLLKVNSRPLYEPAFRAPHYLQAQGIAPVVAPIPTKRDSLWTRLDNWTVSLYPFIEGDTSLKTITAAQWKETGTIFQRIHAMRLPQAGFGSIRIERFDPSAYVCGIGQFESEHLQAGPRESDAEQTLHASWLRHRTIIHKALTYLEGLAEVLRARGLPNVLCHADLHAANLLRDRACGVHVIDWDEVMLAPKERDFIFVREPHGEPFLEGYGLTEIDWTALTYFRWERVVQDLIEYAEAVCFRGNLSENTKAELASAFQQNLSDSSNLKAAHAAMAQLPTDLAHWITRDN